MFERFSPAAREAVQLATREARVGSDRVRPEHLILGVVRQESTRVARLLAASGASIDRLRRCATDHDTHALARIGVSLDEVTKSVGEVVGTSEPLRRNQRGANPPFSRQARRLLVDAEREARRHRSRRINPEHLILAACRGQNAASDVLRRLGVDLTDLADKIESACA